MGNQSTLADRFDATQACGGLTPRPCNPLANGMPLNQCDGCRVRAPLTPSGNHLMPDGGYMGCTKDRYLAPLQFIPAPLVIETDGESAWAAWDYAVEQLDANTPEGRAMALATA